MKTGFADFDQTLKHFNVTFMNLSFVAARSEINAGKVAEWKSTVVIVWISAVKSVSLIVKAIKYK